MRHPVSTPGRFSEDLQDGQRIDELTIVEPFKERP